MKLYELLSEARRNPEVNIKDKGHPAALNFLRNRYNDIQSLGVSMTDLPKLGINPGSQYNTPIGIYFYPASYYVTTKINKQSLDFKDDAPYIQILELLGNFEYISIMSESVFTAYVKKLYENAGRIGSYINKSEKETKDLLSRLLLEARSEAQVNSYGGWLWYILYSLGFYAGRDKRFNAPPRSSVVWNAILRLLGIDGLIDLGDGILHPNEPTSGVVINPRSIRHVATFENKSDENNTTKEQLEFLANLDSSSDYIEQVIDAVMDNDLKYSTQYKKECQQIMNKVLAISKTYPNVYVTLTKEYVQQLLKLTNDVKVVQQIMIDYWSTKFYRLKNSLDDTLEMWKSEKAEPGWQARPPENKLRAQKIYVKQYDLKSAKSIMNGLTTWKNNPQAAAMIEYLNNTIEQLENVN